MSLNFLYLMVKSFIMYDYDLLIFVMLVVVEVMFDTNERMSR